LQEALKAHNVSCELWTLTQPEEEGHHGRTRDFDAILQFLAQLHVLTRASVFVGTFNSNVGSLGAVLRACHYDADNDLQDRTG